MYPHEQYEDDGQPQYMGDVANRDDVENRGEEDGGGIAENRGDDEENDNHGHDILLPVKRSLLDFFRTGGNELMYLCQRQKQKNRRECMT